MTEHEPARRENCPMCGRPPCSSCGVLANVAWDNHRSPSGATFAPGELPTHRKLARMPQQDVGSPQLAQTAITGSQSEVVYVAGMPENDVLADGSRGFQEQQVFIQAGMRQGFPDQRFWVEVYQNSGVPLRCAFDGSSAPPTATRPRLLAWQAPSFMAVKVTDF